MSATRRFPREVVDAIDRGKIIGLRAGTGSHRFIGLWAVVVEGRVFVRSWGLKPDSWFHALHADGRGTMQAADREIPVRAVLTRSDRLKDAVDQAYLAKYHTPGSVQYARDLGSEKSRATTTELVPL